MTGAAPAVIAALATLLVDEWLRWRRRPSVGAYLAAALRRVRHPYPSRHGAPR